MRFKKERFSTLLPLAANIIIIVIVFFVPVDRVRFSVDFYANRKAREEVVRLIECGELEPNVSYNPYLIKLPPRYSYLSKGGIVSVEQEAKGQSVMFYVFVGVLDNFSGFIYRPDALEPEFTDFCGEFWETRRISEH